MEKQANRAVKSRCVVDPHPLAETAGLGLPESRHFLPAVLAELGRQLRPGDLVVDLGCGNGTITHALARAGYDTVGVDASAAEITLARAGYPGLRFACLPVEAVTPDQVGRPAAAVVAIEVIEHLYDPAALFTVARSLLRPGGLLVVTTPYHGYWKNLALSLLGSWDRHFQVAERGGHIKFFSSRTLTAMARAGGFTVLRLQRLGRCAGLWQSIILTGRRP